MVWRRINELALNVWFYGASPLLALGYVALFFPPVALTRLWLSRRQVLRKLRLAISRYGRMAVNTPRPWLKVELRNAPPPTGGAYIFVENHVSAFDPIIQGVLPYELVQAARAWVLNYPVLGRFARWAGYLDVDALAHEDLMSRAQGLLADGVSIVFFPEGTRHSDGQVGPFHGAAFRLAIATGRPLVPVVITGAADWIRKGSIWLRPSRIELRCLPPMGPDDWRGLTPFALKQRVRAEIIAALR
jgi:1-acyl-sn-glycerol-3-phosphate acyltransferase